MLRFLVAPVCLKPGAATAGSDEMENLGSIVRQVQFDRHVRFHNPRYRWIGIAGDLVPGDIVEQIPAAMGFGLVKIFQIQVVKSIFKRCRHDRSSSVTDTRCIVSVAFAEPLLMVMGMADA